MKNSALILSTIAVLICSPVHASDDAKEPITLINVFVVPDGKEGEAIAYWDKAAEFMKKQPGYISTSLHKAIFPDAEYKLINVAKWKSVDAFTKASLAFRTGSGIPPVKGVIPKPSLYTIVRSD